MADVKRDRTDPPNSGVPIVPAPRSKMRCDWCGTKGRVLSPSYPPTYIVGCLNRDCAHEWQVVLSKAELRQFAT